MTWNEIEGSKNENEPWEQSWQKSREYERLFMNLNAILMKLGRESLYYYWFGNLLVCQGGEKLWPVGPSTQV